MDHRFSYWLFLTGALLYPFVVWPGRFGAAWVNPEEVWIFPKVVFLLLVGLLGMVGARRVLPTPFGLLMALYLGLVLLSSFRPLFKVRPLGVTADDPTYTLLGGEGRMDGLLYQIGLVLFALLALWVFRREPHSFRAFSYVLVGGTALQSLLLLLQRLGLDPIGPLLRGLPYEAPVGTIGNPGMVAGLLLPGLLLGLGLWLERKGRFSFPFFPLIALIALGLGVTLNRASLLGLVVALGVWILLRRDPKLALAGALTVLLALFAPALIPDRQGFSRELANPKTGFERLIIWKLAWEGIRSTPGQPLLGGGPDAFRVALLTRIPFERLLEFYRLGYGWPKKAKVREIKPLWTPQDPLRSRAWLVFFQNWSDEKTGKQAKIYKVYLDKAHNLFLDRWLSYGLIAALIWVYLYLSGALKAWGDTPLRQALASGLLGIFLYYLFWFPVPGVEPLHAALVAAAFGLSGGTTRVLWPGLEGGRENRKGP